jgi:hypothetical protein
VPAVLFSVPGIPNSPVVYAKAHPDRIQQFPDQCDEFPQRKKLLIDPEELTIGNNDQSQGWRHELEHDAESVFWLLLYWAMVVQPKNCPKEKINAASWDGLNKDHESRQRLIRSLTESTISNLIHSFYNPLRPLIKDLAAILLIDSHWLPASDPRKDRLYITEAFQRLILQFIIKNRGEEFMRHRVDDTFRKVHGIQESSASSSTHLRSLDASMRVTAMLVGCVCGFVNFCPFLLLCLQDNGDVAMDDSQ